MLATQTANKSLHLTALPPPLASYTIEKDLSVQIDSDLKFREHAASAVTKATQLLAVIRRAFALLDETTLPLLFKTLVRPQLEYGNLIWGPFNRHDQRLVERVQRRATRLVAHICDKPYEERLRCLTLPSLYYRRRRGDMIATYQLLHCGMDVEAGTFFKPLNATTKGHSEAHEVSGCIPSSEKCIRFPSHKRLERAAS